MKDTTPPRIFASLSLLMIMAMVITTGLVQAPFFRQSIIEREAAIVRDLVAALATVHEVSADDLVVDPANERMKRMFAALVKLPDTTRLKVFDRNGTIIWSDDVALVGTRRTDHPEMLAQALAGQVRAVFNPAPGAPGRTGSGDDAGTIECYVPVVATSGDELAEETVIGALSLYRDPHDLSQTIRQGQYLLWAVIGTGGMLLYLVHYKVFSLVYRRQRKAQSQIDRLTVEHERIVQLEKMSAMGELVGEIAHQLNNPLVGVINLTQLAQREVDHPERVAALLADVRKAGVECRDIVQRILRINQASRSTLQDTDLRELVRDTITFCHQSVDPSHVIEFDAPADPVVVAVDPVLLRQALFNLLHNAMLAAPSEPVRVLLQYQARQQVPGVLLEVQDAGAGIDEAVRPKLFKPFFTTRPTGTGLGLFVAQHIAIKHEGVIQAHNRPQGGARFGIWLPDRKTA